MTPPMSDDERIAQIRGLAERIIKLCDQNEQGMFTWWEALHTIITQLWLLWSRANT